MSAGRDVVVVGTVVVLVGNSVVVLSVAGEVAN